MSTGPPDTAGEVRKRLRPHVPASPDAAARTTSEASPSAPTAPPPRPVDATVPAPPRRPRIAPPPLREAPRLVREFAAGLATPGVAAAMQRERDIVAAVRSRQADRRLVAVVAGKGGVGCTTIALGIGTALAAMREDRSILVDLRPGGLSLGRSAGVAQPRTVSDLLAASDVIEPPSADSGLRILDGPTADRPLSRSDVGAVIEQTGREHTFDLFDVGTDLTEGGQTALAHADRIVAVTNSGHQGTAALEAAHERVRRVSPAAVPGIVNVVVCLTEDAYDDLAGVSRTSRQIVVVPPEPRLATGAPFDPAAISGATRTAMLSAAALVASGASIRD